LCGGPLWVRGNTSCNANRRHRAGELDLDEPGTDRTQLMEALDSLNDRYGPNTVSIASSSVASDKQRFSMKRKRKTPECTTRWEDISVAHA